MTQQLDVSRRNFLVGSAAAAGGLSFGFHVSLGDALAQAPQIAPEVNAWVVIKPDDTVVIRIARSEMGQGTLTGLAQLVAEELECDWSKVTTEYPTPGQNVARNRIWKDYSTGGSRGIRESNQYVREGGAAAREMLIQAAANEWKVPATECKAEKSVISHAGSGRTTTYGKVADAAGKLQPPAQIKLKDPKEWKIAGKPLARLDTKDKVNGKLVYAADLKMDGMLCASVKDCPVFGGKIKSFDAAKIQGMPGVKKVLQINPSTVAVVADTWWRAKTALDALPIEYDNGPNANVSSETIAAMLKEGLTAEQAFVGNQAGDAKGAIAGAAKKVEAVYSYPFQNHAPMEPMNALVRWTPEKCEGWIATQNGEAALAVLADAAGLPVAKCDVYKLHLGGGFGRRGAFHDYVRQATMIAKEMPGVPIKLQWTREEDMLHGMYHPITQCKLTGGLDKDGNLVGLHMRISGQSILTVVRPEAMQNGRDPVVFQGLNPGGAEGPFGYGVPNLLIDHAMRNPPVPPGFWRGVNLNQNAIYVECFMDELAHAAGVDPLAFRRKLMTNFPKHLAVLNAVAEGIGYDKPAQPGRFRGLAQIMGFGSYVAAAAEVSVTGGKVKVHKIFASTNPGHVVNPEQVARQVEGSFVYGLSAALYGECTIKGGRVEQENFDTYNVMRIDEMPEVETKTIPSFDFWGGVGEPTIAVAAPAVLNAIFAATGKRVRNLPLKNTDLKTS
ncbi:membrane-bound aldehyde dehydrogenase [pyrroloquinoline-quinone] precursor [Variibacter gotjawalensis]|uniref:Membrane-bound aldehyde dehydrogenase [pyrroloquinoline-quinone] n=1 Tax=Variibacter gotjawalensis TaxID=1333996 RepID=A0A0S3PYF4_9BRAD|nr:molybdopterin cofactor-binding domain-containing protein [Variibacter gotjawalensis]NIK46825.1 isoquinoline 1-oxidoreductase beta subunit [Variibacter gotjawalensis]RZS48729.1 isoquinoline 1-oxidoreductase beta subunit [Variibacter gotjawalensis]BAT60988.1 membrane-bound aldehyde dehydrogenase [pyrroloquinoline-quinone] precursor [Variibacter gotjawalensis]